MNSIESINTPGESKAPFLSVFSFIIGASSYLSVQIIGELFLLEVGLLLLGPILIIFDTERKILRSKLFWQFLIFTFLFIIGLMISDVFQGTPPERYLKAWGRIFFLASNFIVLTLIVFKSKRAFWAFLLGFALGTILYALLFKLSWTDYYKARIGPAIIICILCLVYRFPSILAAILVASFGIFSIFLDARSLGAAIIVSSGCILFKAKKIKQINTQNLVLSAVAISIAVLMLTITMKLTEDQFSERRNSSTSGRLITLKVGLMAILDSPIIGLGSWSESPKYAKLIHKETQKIKMKGSPAHHSAGNRYTPHSQIIQAWVEGGILSGSFIIFLFFKTLQGFLYNLSKRPHDMLTNVFFFLFILQLWHIIASPFLGLHRINVAIVMAALCILFSENEGGGSNG